MIDIKRIEEVEEWLIKESINDIEIVTSDCAGISRGKVMPRAHFISAMKNNSLKMPESILGITVNGDYVFNEHMDETEKDVILIPKLDTICLAPWKKDPTANVVCHPEYEDGRPVEFAPRQVLQRVLDLYAAKGWVPVVAPEFEFYLIQPQENGSLTLQPPTGKSGTLSTGNDTCSLDAVNEFDSFFEDVNKYCQSQNIKIDALVHEAGPSQFEVNVCHGDPMKVADQSFFFKRLLKQAGIKHGLLVTFMARPYTDNFSSAMHVHQSVVNSTTGENVFANEDGSDSDLFLSHIAGLQKYVPNLMPFFAPFVNSYKRLGAALSSPTNLEWARENRSVGLRVPSGGKASRRIENRVAGSDTNPYLIIAASLAAGYLGMIEKLAATEPHEGSAYDSTGRLLPQHILSGIENMEQCKALQMAFDKGFLDTFAQIKRKEYESYNNFLSPWETKYLLRAV